MPSAGAWPALAVLLCLAGLPWMLPDSSSPSCDVPSALLQAHRGPHDREDDDQDAREVRLEELMEEGRALYDGGQYERAVEVFQRVARRASPPSQPLAVYGSALISLGAAQQRARKSGQAVLTLQEAKSVLTEANIAATDERHVQALLYLGRALGDQGDVDAGLGALRDALQACQGALSGSSLHIRVLQALGSAWSEAGQAALALPYLQRAKALGENPKQRNTLTHAAVLVSLGVALAESSEGAAAVPVLEEAKALLEALGRRNSAAYSRVLGYLGRMNLQLGNNVVALDMLRTALELHNFLALADSAFAEGRDAEALRAVQRSLGQQLLLQREVQELRMEQLMEAHTAPSPPVQAPQADRAAESPRFEYRFVLAQLEPQQRVEGEDEPIVDDSLPPEDRVADAAEELWARVQEEFLLAQRDKRGKD